MFRSLSSMIVGVLVGVMLLVAGATGRASADPLRGCTFGWAGQHYGYCQIGSYRPQHYELWLQWCGGGAMASSTRSLYKAEKRYTRRLVEQVTHPNSLSRVTLVLVGHRGRISTLVSHRQRCTGKSASGIG
jgi:hypothetical protein